MNDKKYTAISEEKVVENTEIEYTVDEHTVAVQKKALEILEVFVSVCERLGLEYYLIGGTLLGAVRHKGFIPWDDDIDVGLKRDDYEKFMKNAQKYLPENLFLQNYETEPEYPKAFAKIRNSDTAFIENAAKGLNINHGVFIDIFVLDEYSTKRASSIGYKLKKKLMELRMSYAFAKTSPKVKCVRWVSKLVYPTVNKAVRAKDALAKSCQVGGDKLALIGGYGDERDIFSPEWFAETRDFEFEGLKLKGPAGADEYLTHVYGDYMQLPPVEKRITRHYAYVIDVENSYKKYI